MNYEELKDRLRIPFRREEKIVPRYSRIIRTTMPLAAKKEFRGGDFILVFYEGTVVCELEGNHTVFYIEEMDSKMASYDLSEVCGCSAYVYKKMDWYWPLQEYACERILYNSSQNYNKHHTSMENITDSGFEFKDSKREFDEIVCDRVFISGLKSSLNKRQKELIKRYYYDGMSCKEIAEEEGVCREAISNAIRRARIRMKNSILDRTHKTF